MTARIVLLALASLVACAGSAQAQPRDLLDPACTVSSPSAGVPQLTFNAADRFFRDAANGSLPTLLLSANPIAPTDVEFNQLFDWEQVNERIVRIHVRNGPFFPHQFAGQADCAWVQFWDDVFYQAELRGLYVLPVFDAWASWDSTIGPWANNLYNAANANAECPDPAVVTCLAATPDQLLDVATAGGPGDTFLAWVETLVTRWSVRPNVAGWEVFSEVNKISGATPAAATAFLNEAVARIHAIDSRPVTASLSGIDPCAPDINGNDWDGLAATDLDFIQVHAYAGFPPYDGDLDRLLHYMVRGSCMTKPVFIGESGLDGLLPNGDPAAHLLVEPGARTGVNHAIWAGVVSGAMNARALWFEDGYDRYHYAKYSATVAGDPDGIADNLCDFAQFVASTECGDGVHTFRELYADAAAPVRAFLAGVDAGGMTPVTAAYDTTLLYGAAVGNAARVLGWIRDGASSAATGWAPTATLTGQVVTIDMPGNSADWIVDYYDTLTGSVLVSADVDQDVNGDVTLTLPAFAGSVAFQIRAVAPLDASIDIRPNSTANRIAPALRQPFRVAVYTTSELDVTAIDATTVAFGPGAAVPLSARLRDTDADGVDDTLVLRFRQNQTGLTCGDDGTLAALTGETNTGRSFVGRDVVNVVPCP